MSIRPFTNSVMGRGDQPTAIPQSAPGTKSAAPSIALVMRSVPERCPSVRADTWVLESLTTSLPEDALSMRPGSCPKAGIVDGEGQGFEFVQQASGQAAINQTTDRKSVV